MLTIGLSTTFEWINGRRFTALASDYSSSIQHAGGFPLIIPMVEDVRFLNNYIDRMDVLLLTGGEDINPALYNEVNDGLSIHISDTRDQQEIYLIEGALKKGCPIVGICRGMQLINTFFGGSLYQDIDLQLHTAIEHQQRGDKSHLPSHLVSINKGSQLNTIMGCQQLQVNSRHHQAVKVVAPGFKISAKSPDGVVEGIEGYDGKIIGVQWHPENLASLCTANLKLFQWMVQP